METYIQIQQVEELCQDIYNRQDSYVWTQQIGHLRQNTGTTILGQIRQSLYGRVDRMLYQDIGKWDIYIMTQGQLYQKTLDGIVTIGHDRQDSQLYYDTVDQIIILGYTRQDCSSSDNYARTQQNGNLHPDTADGTIMLGHSRWDSYVWTQKIGQLHYNRVDRMLHQDTVNGTFTLRHRDYSTRKHQMGQ